MRGLSERRALRIVRHERLGAALYACAGSQCRPPRPASSRWRTGIVATAPG